MQWEHELQSFSEEKENEVSGELTRKSKKNEEEKWLGRRKEDSPGNLGAPNSYRSPGMNDEEEEKTRFSTSAMSWLVVSSVASGCSSAEIVKSENSPGKSSIGRRDAPTQVSEMHDARSKQ